MDSSSKKESPQTSSNPRRRVILSNNEDNNKRAWLEAVLIENFQAHEETKIRLDPGVNVFIGSSDSGKSSILRAIKWNLLNIPNGNSFCSFWSANTSVKTKINGRIINRIRTKSKNTYHLGDKEFAAFGSGVPDEILDVHLVRENNIQSQMDSPFLLSQSSGEVARLCNKAVNLELIDTVGKNIRSKLFETRQNKTFNTNALEEYEDKLNKFKNLDKMKAILDEAVLLKKEVDSCYNNFNKIKGHLDIIKDNMPLIKEMKKNEDKLSIIKEIEDKLSLKGEYEEKALRISHIMGKYTECSLAFKKYANIPAKEEIISKIEDIEKDRTESLYNSITITKLIENLEDSTLSYNNYDKEIKKQLDYLYANSPDSCPLCGSDLKGKPISV